MKVDLEALADALVKQSDAFVSATVEYPGYVALHTDGGGLWTIGRANGVWGADLYVHADTHELGDTPDHSIATDLPGHCADVDQIATALYRAMSEIT